MVRAITSAAPSMSATTRRACALVRRPRSAPRPSWISSAVDRVDVKVNGHLRSASVAEPVEQWRAGDRDDLAIADDLVPAQRAGDHPGTMTASTARRCNVRSLRSGELEPASTTTWDSFTSACGRSTAHRGTGAIRREDRPAASAASEDGPQGAARSAALLVVIRAHDRPQSVGRGTAAQEHQGITRE